MNNPGLLDRKLTIQVKTVTRGSAGGVAEAWADLATVWAQLVSTTGREFRASGSLRAETTHAFRIRHRSDLTTQHRIVYGGVAHDIVQIAEEGRRDSMLIQAQATEGRA
jgi:SPP1 family predicted phage head-tail adaptor